MQRQQDSNRLYIDIYNLPEHHNKEDIVYFLYKALERARGLRKPTNPITRAEINKQPLFIRVHFRSRQETLNCLDLNGIYYGERAFYFKSPIASRDLPQLNPKQFNFRRYSHRVGNSFNKLCISQIPPVQQFEILNLLAGFGSIKAYEPVLQGKTLTHCFFQYYTNEETEECLRQLNGSRMGGKTVVVKRAALMNNNQSSQVSTSNSRGVKKNLFQKDLSSSYLTFDTVGFFKSMKISCVLLIKNVISLQSEKEFTKKDIGAELQKVGRVSGVTAKDKNIYVEFERVEDAQIAYLLMRHRKYDNSPLDVSFYDPLNFSEGILI